MINSDDFSKRLQRVIDFYGESASSFAENIGVQRSSISHILSGRNKPSLDFVLKILATYPEVELYWLLNGKGNFPKRDQHNTATPSAKISNEPNVQSEIDKKETSLSKILNSDLSTNSNKQIERIVIFFSDGSFKNYQN